MNENYASKKDLVKSQRYHFVFYSGSCRVLCPLSYTDGVLQRNDDIFYSCGTFTIFLQQYVF